MYKAIYASTWDLVDESLDQALEHIRACGANTVTLAASHAAGPMPQSRPAGRTSSAADGTVYFRARPERYGHIKPQVHPVVSDCDALAELHSAAPDLGRAAWVASCLDAPSDVPEADYLSRNAFGEPSSRRLCPAHPAVRDYVVNLCSDLARGYDLAAVVLEAPSWLPCEKGCHSELAAAPLDRWARTLLSFCFANATRHAARAAGIDADRLQAQARELLERYRAADVVPAGVAAAWFADVVSGPEWAAFLNWRCRQVADLVTDVKAALPAGTALAVILTAPDRDSAGRLEGMDIGMLAAAADALEIPVCAADAQEAYLEARDVRRGAGAAAALRCILRPPLRGDGAATRDTVLELKRVGVAGIAWYDYHHIRRAGLSPAKAAFDALGSA
ncbi:MAG TPA: hypothetical protein VHK45_12655 [Geminicoccaceae bacterium]|nr:hypothetical protein [Geminicoccaceae bacterium]